MTTTTTKTYDQLVQDAVRIWEGSPMPASDFFLGAADPDLSREDLQLARTQRLVAQALVATKTGDPASVNDREQLIAAWNDVRRAAGLDEAPREHQFMVTVSGCSKQEAAIVMKEQIDFWATYGFPYSIGYKLVE